MNVAILHDHVSPDARPDERDALVQAECVAQALKAMGHEPSTLEFVPDLDRLAASLKRVRADAAFNLVESVRGQGRLVYLAPAMFEAIGIPCTGADANAMFVTSNKLLTKRLLNAARLPTPNWFDPTELDTQPFSRGRYIIKSVWEEASLGLDDGALFKADSIDKLRAEVALRAPQLGGDAFAEKYVDGREFNIALLAKGEGVTALPPAEIRFVDYPAGKPRIVGYAAKWDPDAFEYRSTPRTFTFPPGEERLLHELQMTALSCWLELRLSGYARVDFRVDARGRPWILEVNANPCLSPDAGFMAAAARAQTTFEDVVRRLLDDAMRRFTRRKGAAAEHA